MTDSNPTRGWSWRSIPRWAKFAVVLSAALNLLVLGAVASAYLQSSKRHTHMRGGLTWSVVHFVRQLPTGRSAGIRPLIKEVRGKIRPLRRSVRQQRGVVRGLLHAEPFDKAVFETEMAKLLKAEAVYRQAARMPLGAIFSSLTAEERKKYVEWHRKWRRHRRRGRRSRK